VDENTTILEEIRSLLSAPADSERQPSLARIEHTLTSGYARALALEAESWRLERRMGEVMSDSVESEREAARRARELEELARKRTTAEYDLGHLRHLLSTLRTRASDLRATRSY
jgi:hypothetical protein